MNEVADPFAEDLVRERLIAFLGRKTGAEATIAKLKRFTVGFSWYTFGFEASWRESQRLRTERLVLRLGPPNGLFAPYNARAQFVVLKCLETSGMPIPRVYWYSDDPEAFGCPFFICEYVRGEAPIPWVAGGGEAFSDEARGALGEQFVAALATMHKFPWRGTEIETLGGIVTESDAAMAQIEYWERCMRRWELRRYPMLEWAFNWLKDHCPQAPSIAIVHGDYRIGNFLVDDGRITAILDWELVHLGDPHEDLGFMCLRAFRGRSKYMCHLVGREELYRRYGELSGIEVSDRSVRFYEVFNVAKLLIIHIGAARCFEDGRFNDLRMPAMGAQIPRVLLQLESAMEAAA